MEEDFVATQKMLDNAIRVVKLRVQKDRRWLAGCEERNTSYANIHKGMQKLEVDQTCLYALKMLECEGMKKPNLGERQQERQSTQKSEKKLKTKTITK